MKRFEFSLEQILRLREYEERQAELELGRITGECERLRREMASLGIRAGSRHVPMSAAAPST